MIDTHAHLHLPDFDRDRAQVLTRGFALGLTGVVEINLSARDWPVVLALAEADPRVYATLGIHPHEAGPDAPDALQRLAEALPHPRVVAIGETGIDHHRRYAAPAAQERLFAAHLALVRASGLPVVIHCRLAFDDVFRVLDREARGPWRGVFHCFSGGVREAEAAIARGFHIGLGGAVTYDRSRWRPVVRALPADRILFETDAPFLKPAPDRHGRNEPALVYETARQVAEMREVDPVELEAIADANARRLFHLAEASKP